LTPLPADRIVAFEVSPLVNNPVHDGPECIAPGHVTEIGKESKL
jgi:putative SOS response-associated peptidase YedK